MRGIVELLWLLLVEIDGGEGGYEQLTIKE
jgi:hypothetical protein